MNVTYESKAYDRDFIAQKKKAYVKILKREELSMIHLQILTKLGKGMDNFI